MSLFFDKIIDVNIVSSNNESVSEKKPVGVPIDKNYLDWTTQYIAAIIGI